MSRPIKLSDALVLEARQTSAVAERSIAGQIEFWARLGRAIEPLLTGDQALALRRAGDEQPLSTLIGTVDTTEGRRRVVDFLDSRPYPHYEPAEGQQGLLVRVEQNGHRTIGKFTRGEFRPVPGRQAEPSRRKRRP